MKKNKNIDRIYHNNNNKIQKHVIYVNFEKIVAFVFHQNPCILIADTLYEANTVFACLKYIVHLLFFFERYFLYFRVNRELLSPYSSRIGSSGFSFNLQLKPSIPTVGDRDDGHDQLRIDMYFMIIVC